MPEKILVVGATSKVGREVIPRLVASGAMVKAATRRPGDYEPAAGVEVTPFDFDVADSYKPALEGASRVFLLSPWIELHPEMRLNRFIEQARSNGAEHIVFLSPLAVDPSPGASLGLVEKRIAGTGVPYTILRPNWLMQDFSHGFLLPCIRDLGAVIIPGGSADVSFVDARDVAEVAASALLGEPAHVGQTYTLTGGEALTFTEVASEIGDAVDRRISYRPDTDDDEFSSFLQNRWDDEAVGYLLKLFAHIRARNSSAVDPTLASVLGRQPTRFAEFVRDYAAAWR
jgi:uncharacterized protein YbjT (DUF2867 family)